MRVAAAQACPSWPGPAGTTRRVLRWLEDPAAQDVELLAFPETLLALALPQAGCVGRRR